MLTAKIISAEEAGAHLDNGSGPERLRLELEGVNCTTREFSTALRELTDSWGLCQVGGDPSQWIDLGGGPRISEGDYLRIENGSLFVVR